MKIDTIEGLTEEQIISLYDNLIEKDYVSLRCYVKCTTTGITNYNPNSSWGDAHANYRDNCYRGSDMVCGYVCGYGSGYRSCW